MSSIGNLFDFWFEYKTVVPKGFTQPSGKLAFSAHTKKSLKVFKK